MSAVASFWASLVRTVTPIIVGWVVSLLVSAGIPVDDEFRGAIEGLVTAGAAAAWYAIVRLLETYVTPKFGWLLGLAKAPEYVGKHAKPWPERTRRRRADRG